MRVILLLTLLLTCAALSHAQTSARNPTEAATPPGLLLLKFNWYDNSSLEGLDDSDLLPNNRNIEEDASQRQKISTGRTVSNTSERAVVASQPAVNPPSQPPLKYVSKNEQYVYSVKIRNASAKTINALAWEYVFLDPVTRQELGSHKFLSLVKVKPDTNATLTGNTITPPTKVVTARGLLKNERKPFVEQVIIRCVAYSDMTVWENPSSGQGDCQALIRHGGKREH